MDNNARTVPILLEGVGGAKYEVATVTPESLQSYFQRVLLPIALGVRCLPKVIADNFTATEVDVPKLFQVNVEAILSTYSQAHGKISAINYLCMRVPRKTRWGVEVEKQRLWETVKALGAICLLELDWKFYEDYAVLFLLPRPILAVAKYDDYFHKYTYFYVIQAIRHYFFLKGLEADVRSWPLEKGVPLLLDWNFLHPSIVNKGELPELDLNACGMFFVTDTTGQTNSVN